MVYRRNTTNTLERDKDNRAFEKREGGWLWGRKKETRREEEGERDGGRNIKRNEKGSMEGNIQCVCNNISRLSPVNSPHKKTVLQFFHNSVR
jgi:hypothetical protein